MFLAKHQTPISHSIRENAHIIFRDIWKEIKNASGKCLSKILSKQAFNHVELVELSLTDITQS